MSERHGSPGTNETTISAFGVEKTTEQQRLRIPTTRDKILHDWLGIETTLSKLTALDQSLASLQNQKEGIEAFMVGDSHPLDRPKIDKISERMPRIRAQIAALEQKGQKK